MNDVLDECNNFDQTMFNQTENELFEKKYMLFKNTHAQYVNDEHGPYVYGCVDDWIIVFEKLSDTKTNENRDNIICHKYAEYTANKLKVVLMFDKFNPRKTISTYTSVLEICSIVCYEQDRVLERKDFRLNYFKSILVPYFSGLLNPENCEYHGYTGFYVGWHDTGFVSEKGHYYCGEKTGIWKYGSIIKKTTDVCDNDFIVVEYENGNVKNALPVNNNLQLTIYNNPVVNNQKNTYIEALFSRLYDVVLYVDHYIPTYLSQYWKRT